MYEYNARILRVVDGDTVDVDIDLGFGMAYVKQRVRMLGIDTPESRTRDLEEKRFGLAAKKYVQKYLKVGEKYKLCLLYTSPSPRDKRQSRMPSSA